MSAGEDFDRLAEAGLARHRLDLNFADVQLCKRGDYEAVARRLRRKKCRALWWSAIVIGASTPLWLRLAQSEYMVGFYVLIWGLFGWRVLQEYMQARETERFVGRLRQEQEQVRERRPDPAA